MRPGDVLELVLLAVLWGAAYLFMRAAVPAFGTWPMVALRLGIAAAVLLPVLAMRGAWPVLRAHPKELVVLGIPFTALAFMLLAYASLSVTAGFSAVLNATSPLFAALVGRLWLGERISGTRALGLVVGFAGVVVLVWGRMSFKPGGSGLAVLAVLGASTLWGLGANYTRAKLGGLDPVALTVGSLAAGTLFLAPFAAVTWPAQPPGARAWAEVVFMGVASSGLGFLMYYRLLHRIGPVRAMSVTFLNPLVTMVAGVFYLGEAVTLQMLAGCAVILVGTALTLGLIGAPAAATPAASPR
jgi:drug/metabolite transporter (DMT)-like permease